MPIRSQSRSVVSGIAPVGRVEFSVGDEVHEFNAVVGALWYDTSTGLLKKCTAVGPPAVWQNVDYSNYMAISGTDLATSPGISGVVESRKYLSELTTIAAAANTDTAIQIPADTVVDWVATRVRVVIPTAATFSIGIAGATTRYGTGINVAQDTVSKGLVAGSLYYAGATALRITPNVTPGNNSGRLFVVVAYRDVTPPTS